jgi:Fumarylacetoacetase N-terminal
VRSGRIFTAPFLAEIDHVPIHSSAVPLTLTSHQPPALLLNLRPFSGFFRKARMSYIPVSKESHFSIRNIPFGIFSSESNSTPRPATAIGEFVLDLSVLAKEGAFNKVPGFDASTLQQVIYHGA